MIALFCKVALHTYNTIIAIYSISQPQLKQYNYVCELHVCSEKIILLSNLLHSSKCVVIMQRYGNLLLVHMGQSQVATPGF